MVAKAGGAVGRDPSCLWKDMWGSRVESRARMRRFDSDKCTDYLRVGLGWPLILSNKEEDFCLFWGMVEWPEGAGPGVTLSPNNHLHLGKTTVPGVRKLMLRDIIHSPTPSFIYDVYYRLSGMITKGD